MSPIYYNDSGYPNMQGGTNDQLIDSTGRIPSCLWILPCVCVDSLSHPCRSPCNIRSAGVCQAPLIVALAPGQPWTGTAAEVVRVAGRRSLPLPPLVAPPVSPPVNLTAEKEFLKPCVRFAARKCDPSKPSQKWILSDATPGKPTNVRSEIANNGSCWQANNCGYGTRLGCDALTNINGAHGGSTIPPSSLTSPGCKALPSLANNKTDHCNRNQAFQFNANGTISLAAMTNDRGAYMHHCLSIVPAQQNNGQVGAVGLAECVNATAQPSKSSPSQVWTVTKNADGKTVSIKQGTQCVDNNYNRPTPGAAVRYGKHRN